MNGLVGRCPMPKHIGDANNENAFTVLPDEGLWSCWTHQCHEQYGRDLISLVRTFYQCSFRDACEFITQTCGAKEVSTLTNDEYNDVSNMLRHNYEQHIEPVSEILMEHLKPRYDYMLARGFTEDILLGSEVGYYEGRTDQSFMRSRIVFPLRHIDGMLVGFIGRTLVDNEAERKNKQIKKWLVSSSLQLNAYLAISNILYNANRAKEISRGKSLILVEGPIDVLKLRMAGFENVCAVLGSSFSRQQEILVRKMGVRVVLPLFDNDKAGNDLCRRVNERFERDIIQVENVELPEGQDPGGLSVEEAKGILNDFLIQ